MRMTINKEGKRMVTNYEESHGHALTPSKTHFIPRCTGKVTTSQRHLIHTFYRGKYKNLPINAGLRN